MKPAEETDIHRSAEGYALDRIFCTKEERVLQNDFVIAYKKRLFQLRAEQKTILRPKDNITVEEHLDGTIVLSIRKTILFFTEIKARKPFEVNKQRSV